MVGFAAGAGAWMYATRVGLTSRLLTIRPLWLVMGFALSILLVGAVGKVFPQYEVAAVGERLAHLQQHAEQGGSQLPDWRRERALPGGADGLCAIGPVQYILPAAVFQAVERDGGCECRGGDELSCSYIGWLGGRNGFSTLLARVMSNPRFAFAFALVLTLGIGVGLATSNLGTLSRYRAPFYGILAAVGLYWYLQGRYRTDAGKRASLGQPGPPAMSRGHA